MPDLHPENEDTWEIFRLVQTQIRVAGMGDFVGYDLTLVPFLLESKAVPRCKWSDIMYGLVEISAVAVRLVNENKKSGDT